MSRFSRREELGALVLAGLLAAGLFLRFVLLPRPAGEIIIERSQEQAPAAQAEAEKTILVHVAGAVSYPGVYALPEGARVHEAVAAAGGPLPEGNLHALNLAEPLYDGRKVTVPFAADLEPGVAERDGRVNINTATAAELEKLPGIGPAKAAAIAAYREKNGPFKSLEQLAEVSGIGPKTVEALRDYITLY